jgi:tripartite-type tricarboxylate transporter receptor subunit TctC
MKFRLFAIAAATMLALTGSAAAQGWPTKPVKVIVPFAAGGSTDIAARVIAQRLGEVFGQQFVVDNRVGAGGTIGADAAAKADRDGYTILMGTGTTHGAAKSVYKRLPYDPIKDFAPISLFCNVQTVVAVSATIPAKNPAEFIAYLKANPKKVNYGSAGLGASQHMFAVLFESRAGVEMQHIPYRGGGPAMQALVAGDIQVIFAPLSEAGPQLSGDRVKLLAIVGDKRLPQYPNVPALAEVLPSYNLPNFNGLLAPAGTPPEIVRKIYDEVAKAIKIPEIRKKLEDLGFEPMGSTPEQFATIIRQTVDIYPEIVKASGVSVD